MIAAAGDSNRMDSLSAKKHVIDLWYQNLKSQGEARADLWLANMKTIEKLLGTTPEAMAEMRPEVAYNLVLDLIKALHSEGRSFAYIEGVARSVDEWLEFNQPKRISPVDISDVITGIMKREVAQNTHVSEDTQIAELVDSSGLSSTEQLTRIAETSNSILALEGNNLVSELRKLEAMLNPFDLPADTVIETVDKLVNKGVEMDLGAYYLAAYSSTKDVDKSLMAYRLVNSMMRYIALADSFYETGDKESYNRANRVLDEVSATAGRQMNNSLRLAIEKFWPFWQFENIVKQRMLKGSLFTDKELRYFILFKSSDTPTIYCTVLDNMLDMFSPNVASVFHYNQTLIDILDDYYDIEEDIYAQMPNIFILGSAVPWNEKTTEPEKVSLLVTQAAKLRVLGVVDWISGRLAEISLPPQYNFLKQITEEHIRRLQSILT